MPALARNADGDTLLFVHRAAAISSATSATWPSRPATTSTCRAARCGGSPPPTDAAFLLIQATGAHFTLPERGVLGPHAIFDPAVLETPSASTTRSAPHQDQAGEVASR